MGYVIGANKIVRLDFAEEEIHFEVREPTTDEITKYINTRMPVVRGKVQSNVLGAAVVLFDQIVVQVEGLEIVNDKGDPVTLDNEYPDWKKKIPPHFKRAVSSKFDETNAEIISEAKPT